MDKLKDLWNWLLKPYRNCQERKHIAARMAKLNEQDPYIYK